MPCFRPRFAVRAPDGTVELQQTRADALLAPGQYLELSCKTCGGCRTRRVRSWAIRAYHEAQTHTREIAGLFLPRSSFITLTYREEDLPEDGALDHRAFQLFFKRLRNKTTYEGKLKFLMCGEYGETYGRPHFHACVFGEDFADDRVKFKDTAAGALWTSEMLEECWPHGYHTIGDLTWATASYTAGYVVKKLKRDAWLANPENSIFGCGITPIWVKTPEYVQMSRGGRRKDGAKTAGLGRRWIERWYQEVYPRDQVRIGPKESKPPEYYDRALEVLDPELFQKVMAARIAFVEERGPTSDYQLKALEAHNKADVALRPRRNTGDTT